MNARRNPEDSPAPPRQPTTESDDLPPGWVSVALGQLVELNPKHAATLPDSTPVSFVPMAAVSEMSPILDVSQTRPLSSVRKGFTHFADGDVLFAKITPCMENGKGAVASGLSNGLGCGTTELVVLRSLGAVDPLFLYRFLAQPSVRSAAKDSFTGSAGQARVPASFLQELATPIPPLAEQRRIVAKLEELLAKVDASRQRLAKVPVLLKRFRQAVLAAASSGHLTADWREKNDGRLDSSAADFVRSAQVERKKSYEERCAQAERENRRGPKRPKNDFSASIDEENEASPERWCMTRICDICDCLDHLRVPVNKDERSKRQGAIPYYGANGQVGTIDDYLFDEDLVLVVEDETFIGREKPFSYVIRGKTWVNNHAHALRPIGGMSVNFLNVALSYYDFTPLTSGTTGRRKLNQEALMIAPLQIPPLAEQEEIVRRVEAMFALADAIEARFEKARAQVERLTPALIAKAFRGQLVPQNPGDESASVMLARLRSSTAAAQPDSKRQTRLKKSRA